MNSNTTKINSTITREVNHETPVSEMTVTELCREFRILRRNSEISATHEEWMTEVERIALTQISKGEEPTPGEWVEAARMATTVCPKCWGTGEYQWGAVINGRSTHKGPCFQCESKGVQDQDDYRRNFGFIRYAIVQACR